MVEERDASQSHEFEAHAYVGGDEKMGEAQVGSSIVEGSDMDTKRARKAVQQAREDAEAADRALQSLRLEVEALAEGWAEERVRILGKNPVPVE